MQYKKVSFIGAGNMTSAIIRGLVASGYPKDMIMASNPSRGKLDVLASDCGIQTTQTNTQAVEFGDIVVLAVKPQLMADVCSSLVKESNIDDKCFVSIAAGIPCKRLSEMLNGHSKIVRVMPNTPSAIGQGMSGVYATEQVHQEQVQFVADMMKKVGDAIVVANEDDIDTVIAAAGSSPAYFFLIAEAMQSAAVDMGLSTEQARQLVQQAMLGSAMMLKQNSEVSPAQLRANVTSKGGTTHEAVVSLQNNKLDRILAEAMQAAVKRAREMAAEF
ncbi:pyrroline-5-carboxylate reductase [Glaciecola sp. 1036]|uniref:pyrroline-5-carboxylate reductase n=1 Tax=Alteromonadaceae TaxID=72275 RepID=UPI003D014313